MGFKGWAKKNKTDRPKNINQMDLKKQINNSK